MISQTEKRNICNVCETESWMCDIDIIKYRDEVCGCAIDKECHRICVCPCQRYRAAGLLEFERAEVQFFSVAWIPTYNVRLSVCVGGEGAET